MNSNSKVSVGILTYNHEKFIKQCLLSLLNLNYKNLEIIISDDCSTDRTFAMVEEIVKMNLPHLTIILNRNTTNLGLIGNFNRTFHELATGEFFMTLGGDDKISENYIPEALEHFIKDDEIMMIDFNAEVIDENDHVSGVARNLDFEMKFFDIFDYLAFSNIHSFAPGRLVRSTLIKGFPPISKKCPTEDSVLVLRALMLGKLLRINENVILYRRHSANISSVTNLKKLSNNRIITQYLSDALFLYDHDIISELSITSLLRRIHYELKKRTILYGSNNKYVKRIRWEVMKFTYRFTSL